MSIKNLGNVAGVVRGTTPPKEADGVTEKRYVIWAKQLPTTPVTYELRYYDNELNTWEKLSAVAETLFLLMKQKVFGTLNDVDLQALLGVDSLLEAITTIRAVPAGKFQIYKHVTNTDPARQNVLEIKDMGCGWIDATTFMPLGQYIGGPVEQPSSWNGSQMTDLLT